MPAAALPKQLISPLGLTGLFARNGLHGLVHQGLKADFFALCLGQSGRPNKQHAEHRQGRSNELNAPETKIQSDPQCVSVVRLRQQTALNDLYKWNSESMNDALKGRQTGAADSLNPQGESQSEMGRPAARDRMSMAAAAPSPALMMAWLRPGRVERPTT